MQCVVQSLSIRDDLPNTLHIKDYIVAEMRMSGKVVAIPLPSKVHGCEGE